MIQLKFLQLLHKAFWNLIGTANSRAAEVNSLNLGKLPGLFLHNEPSGYEANLREVNNYIVSK